MVSRLNEVSRQIGKLVLQGDGFTAGAKQTYRRKEGHVIQIIWFQEIPEGGRFCVNLGVHLNFLLGTPGMARGPFEELLQPDCEITKRMGVDPLEADHWWDLDMSEDVVASVCVAYRDVAVPFFARFADFTNAWRRITISDLSSDASPDALPRMSRPRAALMLARVHSWLGDCQRAREFAEYGLSVTPPMARPIIAYLKAVIAEPGKG